ncbi:hypothetical protein ACQEVG_14035 [Streptomyces sp. CA-135486]|uniref:hypothetical protein n=1 Tax=Streptomyces sp. CA-135486 TaxID=3240049 RepID=UPI003D8B7DD2
MAVWEEIGREALLSHQFLVVQPPSGRRWAAAVNRLAGHFVTGEDVGISVDEVALMRENTPHALGGEGVDSRSSTTPPQRAGRPASTNHR